MRLVESIGETCDPQAEAHPAGLRRSVQLRQSLLGGCRVLAFGCSRENMSATYPEILDRSAIPKLESLGFTRVELSNCMWPEVLLRREALWFGTSWDWRDQYLQLNLGGLYWLRDVMPRVVVLGEYSAHCAPIKRLSPKTPGYLEEVAAAIEGSIEEVLRSHDAIQASEARSAAMLRPLLISKVRDEDLEDYRAG
jgi:hypothetical protein